VNVGVAVLAPERVTDGPESCAHEKLSGFGPLSGSLPEPWRVTRVLTATVWSVPAFAVGGWLPPWQLAGIAKPFVGLVLWAPPLTASEPRPKPAKACHMRQTSWPAWLSAAACRMPSRTCVNVGLHAVFFIPSLT